MRQGIGWDGDYFDSCRQQASNFACFLCNWVSVSWKEVQEHLVTAQHTEQQAVWAARLQNTLM